MRYQLSIIPPGGRRSTWHGQSDAINAEDAVRQYINGDLANSEASRVAQTTGGIVIVGEVNYQAKHGYNCHGVELFEVEPIQPVPVDRARIVRRIGG